MRGSHPTPVSSDSTSTACSPRVGADKVAIAAAFHDLCLRRLGRPEAVDRGDGALFAGNGGV